MIQKLIQLSKKYDKLAHFIVGLVFGIFGLDYRLSFAIFAGKEVYDCYKPNPTGFGWDDIGADLGGYCLGVYINNLIGVA